MSWQPIKTAPRDGTNILLAWGQDGVSQGHYVPGLKGTHPWKFIDTNDGITWLINHAVDGPGGPTHWQPMPPKLGWCSHCGEGVTTFCRGSLTPCPKGLPKATASGVLDTKGGSDAGA